jgi:hypothetical protein
MGKMKLNKTKKQANDYIRIFGWIMVVIIPLFLITGTYIKTYQESLKVSFDSEATSESLYIQDFLIVDDIQTIELMISWIEFKRPTLDTNGDLMGGSYTFHISYVAEPGISVSQVVVTPVLQTKWASIREVGVTQMIGSSATEFKLDFNYSMPQRPLYFVQINEPILYLRISLVQHIGATQFPHTYYVIYDLTNEYPIN